MHATTLKTIRDLRRQGGQVVAVTVTIMLGVLLYVASAGAFQNLSGSYRSTYDQMHFADLTATGGTPATVAEGARAAGAATATTRVQFDPPMLIDGTKLLGRVIGVPTDARPAVNDVRVIDGNYLDPGATDQVLVETHAAETFGITVGDTVQVFGAGSWHTVTVQGIVRSAEYLWPARSRQDVISDSHSFAVLFAPEATAEAWAGTGPDQTLVLMPAGSTLAQRDTVAKAMRLAGAADVTPWQDQASQATLNEDLTGFNEMAVAFPLLFLSAAGVAAYVLLSRRILQERPVIGTLMASGARPRRVLRHYLSQGLTVGLIGSVLGVVLGLVATGAVTTAYANAIGVPDVVVSAHPWLVVNGLAFGVIVGLLGAWAPALRASRTAPAEAMRSAAPAVAPGPWSRAVARMTRLPATTRMALRDVGRSRRRTFATMLGSVLSLVLVLATVGMMTSMIEALHLHFDKINKEDATVVVDNSVAASAQATLAGIPGVKIVEPSAMGEVTALSDGHSYVTSLRGFEPGTTLHGFHSTDGSFVSLPSSGVLAGVGIADALHVKVGDTITLSTTRGQVQVVLKGFLSEPLGTTIYSTNAIAATVLPDSGVTSYVMGFDSGVNRDQMRTTVTNLPGVVAYNDSKAFAATLDQYLGLFWVFGAVMIALGAVLALAVIYVTMAVNVVERTNELATLRASGVPLRKVSGTIATESLVATALGLPFGLVLGIYAAKAFLASFSSDIFQFPLVMPWYVLVGAAAGVLAAAGLSLWPASRAIARVDVAKVVRERSI